MGQGIFLEACVNDLCMALHPRVRIASTISARLRAKACPPDRVMNFHETSGANLSPLMRMVFRVMKSSPWMKFDPRSLDLSHTTKHAKFCIQFSFGLKMMVGSQACMRMEHVVRKKTSSGNSDAQVEQRQ